jgi:hypothetical protein
MQRLTKLSLRRNVEYNVQLLSINVHVINHFIVIGTNSNIFCCASQCRGALKQINAMNTENETGVKVPKG